MLTRLIFLFGLTVFVINAQGLTNYDNDDDDDISDLIGLDDENDALDQLDTALSSPVAKYGTNIFLDLVVEFRPKLNPIAIAFRGVFGIIRGIVRSKERKRKMQQAFNAIHAVLNLVINELQDIKNEIADVAIYQTYWLVRQPILYVQVAHDDMVGNPNSTYYLNEFITECQKYNLRDTLLSIDNFICGSGGLIPTTLTADFNRDKYNYFLRLVMGDSINAAILQEACLGVLASPDYAIEQQANQMYDWITNISAALQAGDDHITHEFMPYAQNIVEQVISSHQGAGQQEQAELAQSALQDQFTWLQWSQIVGNAFDGASNHPDPISDYSSYGYMYIYDKEYNRAWVSFWVVESPTVNNWKQQLDNMTHSRYFCCKESPTNTFTSNTGYGSKCLVDAINDPSTGIPGVHAYYSFVERDYDTGYTEGGSNGCHYVSFCQNQLHGMVCAGPDK